ncbi:DUF1294 domain-containing protein [Desulfotruncus alcoholivorax]|uniref:DUF1294 domain-containing protein n=1 Tax=Desulfotruncus alcoholivorax TaxID=265477 RepID=UPI00041A8893
MFATYILTVNLITFLLFGLDKRRAHNGRRRIPEKTLFALALAGGAPGALAGMRFFRHKTRHRTFTLGLPAILLVQLLMAYYYYFM